MIASFEATVQYAQINIFRPQEPDTNLWSDEHVAQGFAWREGSVSFGVPDHDGPVWIEVERKDAADPLSGDTMRAIEVPFTVYSDGVVYASLIDDLAIPVPFGAYRLRFEIRPGFTHDETDFALLIVLTFIPDATPDFAILRGDTEVTAQHVLLKTATPAR